MELIPIDCFLNRVFPISFYKDEADYIVDKRIFKPRKDCEDFPIILPIDWEARTQKEDRNWRMQLQGWAMFFPIMNFFDEYHDQNKIIYYFFEVAADWFSIYGNDSNDIVTTRMPESYAWYDMSVGFRALVIAFFKNRIDANNIPITKIQSELLQKLIIKHILHLRNEKVFSLNNHGMFQIQGLMALIQLQGVSNYQPEFYYALEKMEALIRSQFDNKGVHLEHSPHYHFYALTTFEKVLKNHWYDSKPIIRELVTKATAVKKWIVDPLCRPACIGDSILTIQRSVDFDNHDFSSELEIQTSNGVLSNFYESGYQIYRSTWEQDPQCTSYIFFMGMYHSKSHKHRDCLSFEWFDKGEKVICDSGKYGYISNKYRNYFLSNRAHNTVEIEGFDILRTKPYGSSLKEPYEDNGIIIMTGELDYPAINHHRKLFIKPHSWIIVEDNLTYQKEKNTTQWFHPDKRFKLKSSVNNRVVLESTTGLLILNCLESSLRTQLHYGDEHNMQGFISEKDFLYDRATAIGFNGRLINKKIHTIVSISEEGEKQAIRYLADIMNSTSAQKQIPEIPKTVLGKLINVNRTQHERFDLLVGKYTYSYKYSDILINFYANIKNSDKLTIMLPGAVNRSKTLYNFQRHSWSEEIEGSVISFLDPTVHPDNDITIGWFQGAENKYAIPVLINFIKDILEANEIEEHNLTIFGSSAGGFSSLKVADSFPESRIIVINPQTRIYNYSYKEYEKLVKWVFPNLTPEQAKIEHKDRLEVSLNLEDRQGVIYYYQNTEDGHHLHHHLTPLLATLDANMYTIHEGMEEVFKSEKKLQIIKYSDEDSGHSPLGKEDTLRILNS